jgi:hypothetical protein
MIQDRPGQRSTDAERQAEIDKGKIDICDDTYAELRNVLLDHGTKASQWIRHFLFCKAKTSLSLIERDLKGFYKHGNTILVRPINLLPSQPTDEPKRISCNY